jgi:hypothetical protein
MTAPLLVVVRPTAAGVAVLIERLTGRPADLATIRAGLGARPRR